MNPHAHDVSCLRVGECAVDLANPDHVLQIEGQPRGACVLQPSFGFQGIC